MFDLRPPRHISTLPDRCHEWLDAHDVHDAGEVVGQNAECHLIRRAVPVVQRCLMAQLWQALVRCRRKINPLSSVV